MKKITFLLIFSYCINLNAQTTIKNIVANDLVYSTIKNKVFAVVSSVDYQYGNSLIQWNPNNGEVEKAVYVGSDPSRIKLTFDENYAYVSFSSIGYLKRIDLNTFLVDKEISLGPIDNSATAYAMDFEIIPNTIDRVVVSRTVSNYNDYFEDLVLYIDGELQPQKILKYQDGRDYHIIEIVAKSDGKTIFGYNSASSGFNCYRIAVSDTGVSIIDEFDNLIEGFCKIKIHDDIVYSGNGRVINAFAEVPYIMGVCPVGTVNDGYGFTVSEIHEAYIYPYQDYDKLYLNFYNMNTYSYSGSLLIELPSDMQTISYKVLSLDVIDQNSIIFILTDIFNYQVIVLKNINNTSINNDIHSFNEVNIFPNPTHDFITISNIKNINEIILTTLDGRIIKKISKVNDNRLSLSGLQNGLYLLHIKYDNNKTYSKLISKY